VVVVALLFAPLLFVWLTAGLVRRRRRGEPVLSALPWLSRPGEIAFWAVGYAGLALVSAVYVAGLISTSTDEHAAPILGVWLIFGLFVIAATDLVIQGALAAGRVALPLLSRR
jgi:hypothetical protein